MTFVITRLDTGRCVVVSNLSRANELVSEWRTNGVPCLLEARS